MRRLRIALIAPPWYPLPPHGYGGTELVVHLLARELRRLGHDLRVYGARGSCEGVEELADQNWTSDLGGPASRMREATYLARVLDAIRCRQFDIIHDHSGPFGALLALESHNSARIVHTIHSSIDDAELDFYREIADRVALIAISKAQAASARPLRVAGVVYNAVDVDALDFRTSKEGYLVELARICPEKGQHLAIEAARRLKRKLVLAGKVERSSEARTYFDEQIRPALGPQVEYRPNVAGRDKAMLLAGASAGIFPLQWPEPFGLALVETMASGTPVLAFPGGAAAELVQPGVTGFLATTVDGLVEGFRRLEEIDPVRCASESRRRFSPRRMAVGYLDAYDEYESLKRPIRAADSIAYEGASPL